MADKIDYVSSWVTRLASRLYTQFRGKITWSRWVALLGQQAQDWEDAAQTLLTLLSIDDSQGVQLDNIGKIIGQPRLGVDDPTYRLYLKARVLANRSTGTPEEIYAVFVAMFGTSAQLYYYGGWVKQFAIHIGTLALTRTQALIAASFLGDAKEAGARGILEWQEYADSQMFEFAASPGTDSNSLMVAFSATDTELLVFGDVTSTWTRGSLVVSTGTVREEHLQFSTSSYNSGTNRTTVGGLTRTAPVAHNIGDVVDVVFGPGLGFDDGYFAGSIQA